MNKIIVFILVLSIASCSIPQVQNPMNIKALLTVGSTLRLTQKLLIPKDRSFIYIANGKIAPLKNYNTVDIYEPYCMFYLDKEESYQQKVLPDEFEITNIIEIERDFAKLNVMKAVGTFAKTSEIIKTGAVGGDDGGPSIVMYATIINLYSDKQHNVKKLVCGHWNDQYESEPLTLEEMKYALGDLILIGNVDSKIRIKNSAHVI